MTIDKEILNEENSPETAEEVITEENAAEETIELSETDILKAQLSEKEDSYLRLYADFDNYRKRASKEKLEAYTDATSSVMEKLLPVIDNLERALSADAEETPFYSGVKMVAKQLDDTLTSLGLEKIQAQGAQFDPNFHYAVMTESLDDREDNEIVDVFQAGYAFKGKVIRPSMVKVNQK